MTRKPAGHHLLTILPALLLGCALSGAATASGEQTSSWDFQAALYVYLPTLSGSTAFPPEDGSSGIGFDTSTLLNHLKMTFMGSFGARHGPWGGFADVIYIDLGNSRTVSQGFTIGGMPLPSTVTARTDLDIKGSLWTIAGTYRALSSPQYSLDVLAGSRWLNIKQTLTWQLSGDLASIAVPDRAGTRATSPSNWDAIAGVKGRTSFGPERKYFALYYLDAGAGRSRFTTQLMGGAGYAFQWGELLAAWRYIDYQMSPGERVERLNLTGPLIAAQFRW